MEEMNAPTPESRKGISKDSLVIAGAVVLGSLVIAASLFSSGQKGAPAPATDSSQKTQAPAKTAVTMDMIKGLFDGQHVSFGNKDSKLVFVEFSDPSCPYCSIASGQNADLNKKAGSQFLLAKDGGAYVPPVPEIKKLVDAGKAAFVWVYANGHGNGEMGTRAFYCANEKGKFWPVHDLLMSGAGYDLLNNTVKNDLAKAAALADFLKGAVNPGEMQACLTSGKYDSHLTDDMTLASQFGFSGTPSFFVGTDSFAGAYSFKDMQATVDKYLK